MSAIRHRRFRRNPFEQWAMRDWFDGLDKPCLRLSSSCWWWRFDHLKTRRSSSNKANAGIRSYYRNLPSFSLSMDKRKINTGLLVPNENLQLLFLLNFHLQSIDFFLFFFFVVVVMAVFFHHETFLAVHCPMFIYNCESLLISITYWCMRERKWSEKESLVISRWCYSTTVVRPQLILCDQQPLPLVNCTGLDSCLLQSIECVGQTSASSSSPSLVCINYRRDSCYFYWIEDVQNVLAAASDCYWMISDDEATA